MTILTLKQGVFIGKLYKTKNQYELHIKKNRKMFMTGIFSEDIQVRELEFYFKNKIQNYGNE